MSGPCQDSEQGPGPMPAVSLCVSRQMSGGTRSPVPGLAKESWHTIPAFRACLCLSHTTCSCGWGPWEAISEVKISTQECSGGHYFGSKTERNRFRQSGKLS